MGDPRSECLTFCPYPSRCPAMMSQAQMHQATLQKLWQILHTNRLNHQQAVPGPDSPKCPVVMSPGKTINHTSSAPDWLPAKVQSRSHQHAKDAPAAVTRHPPDQLKLSNHQGMEQMNEPPQLQCRGKSLDVNTFNSVTNTDIFVNALTYMHWKTNATNTGISLTFQGHSPCQPEPRRQRHSVKTWKLKTHRWIQEHFIKDS